MSIIPATHNILPHPINLIRSGVVGVWRSGKGAYKVDVIALQHLTRILTTSKALQIRLATKKSNLLSSIPCSNEDSCKLFPPSLSSIDPQHGLEQEQRKKPPIQPPTSLMTQQDQVRVNVSRFCWKSCEARRDDIKNLHQVIIRIKTKSKRYYLIFKSICDIKLKKLGIFCDLISSRRVWN